MKEAIAKMTETQVNAALELIRLKARNHALQEAHDIALAIDSNRGNEKEIAKAIKALIVK